MNGETVVALTANTVGFMARAEGERARALSATEEFEAMLGRIETTYELTKQQIEEVGRAARELAESTEATHVRALEMLMAAMNRPVPETVRPFQNRAARRAAARRRR